MTLPAYPKWKVCDDDIACEGVVVLYTKLKGFFFETFSTVKPRYVCLTRTGFLVVYMKGQKGHILNIPTATSIECKTEVMKKSTTRRCRIKIRFPSGNIYMYVMNSEVAKWRDAMNAAYDALSRNTMYKREQNRTTVPLSITYPASSTVPPSEPAPSTTSDKNISQDALSSESFTDITRTVSFSQRDEPSVMEDRVYQHKLKSNFQVFKRKMNKHSVIIEELEDDDDSTNSGFVTEYTVSEESVRANPAFTVREIRTRLEGCLNKAIDKKLEKTDQFTPKSQKIHKADVACAVTSEDFSDLNYWHRDLNSSNV